jgi:glutamate/aspartate transport system substrate-binding protein
MTTQPSRTRPLMQSSCAAVLAFTLFVGAARAQAGDTLAEIKDSGLVSMGVRSNVVPLSFASPDGASPYTGYMVDVCRSVMRAIMPNARTSYVEVSPQTRMSMMEKGLLDMECGGTADVASRRTQVAFSTPVLLPAARLVTSNKLRIKRVDELNTAVVVVLNGTTFDKVLRNRLGDRAAFQAVYAASWKQALDMVLSGQADAMVADDFILARLLAEANANEQVNWVDEPVVASDPIAIMLPKDDRQFKSAVDAALANMVASKELVQLYNRWFKSKLDNGLSMNMPPSAQMRQLLGLPAAPASTGASQGATGRDDPKVFGRGARGG